MKTPFRFEFLVNSGNQLRKDIALTLQSALEDVGIDRIWSRTCVLTARLKDGINRSDRLQLATPEAGEDSAALVSFGVDEASPEELRDRLRSRHNIVIKAVYATRKGMRASVPFFLLEEEIDFLLEKLEEELR